MKKYLILNATFYLTVAIAFISCTRMKPGVNPAVADAMKAKIDSLQDQNQAAALKAEYDAQAASLKKSADTALESCKDDMITAGTLIQQSAFQAQASGGNVKQAIEMAGIQASSQIKGKCKDDLRLLISMWTSTAGGGFAQTQQGTDFMLDFFGNLGQQAAGSINPYFLMNPEYQCSLLSAGQSATGNFLNQAGYQGYQGLANSYYGQYGSQMGCPQAPTGI